MTQQINTCRQPAKLVWRKLNNNEFADTTFGTFYQVWYHSEKNLWFAYHSIYGNISEHSTKELAQAVCQEDYNRRWVEGSEPLKTYRHIKRGTEYTVLGNTILQIKIPLSDMAELVVYQGDDGQIWIRPKTEFFDGRFEEVI